MPSPMGVEIVQFYRQKKEQTAKSAPQMGPLVLVCIRCRLMFIITIRFSNLFFSVVIVNV